MLSKKDVRDLYLQYGFEEGESCDQYLVFFSQSGYFQNAEIVILQDDFDTDTIDKIEYENLGYSVRIKRFSDITAVHNALFNGFFGTGLSNRRLLTEYASFCEQQSRKLANNKYEYVGGAFVENGSFQSGSVINRILELFASDDRQLIILEASAGFGKTCTSFETIRYLIEKMPSKIPLLAELSKNRKASVFRYVLLSEIAMLRNHLRIRMDNAGLLEEIKQIFDSNPPLAKEYFRVDRKLFLLYLSNPHLRSFPKNLNNIVFLINELIINDLSISAITPTPIKSHIASIRAFLNC